MTKTFLSSILLLFSVSAYSQAVVPDNFTIGNFFEVYNGNNLKVYFNCMGTIVDKTCASFYRIGKMDTEIVNFVGEFQDFDKSDKLYFKGSMINNKIEGYACYYFKNGKISEEGNFKNNARIGKWTYYYPSGTIEKIYFFDASEPTVLEAYNKDGTATVINGNGNIRTEFRNYKQCTGFETWGSLVNGKKNGEWTFSNSNAINPIATETYQDGVFLRGTSNNYVYTEKPSIKLSKFYANENLNLVKNSFGCPGDGGIVDWQYDGGNLTSTFYPRLQEELNKDTTKLKNQWIVVGIKIHKNNLVREINLASSVNDTALENRVYATLEKMKSWKAASLSGFPTASSIYFSILVDNNHILVLPNYA
jgi:antitoxin component YwqK of YwqJK toxin-antitoxin module